jgi:hypothetical protein
MAPDSRSTAEDASAPTWTSVERGAFMVGRCDRCGFESPARRASYSVESDMRTHSILCRAEEAVGGASESLPPEPSTVRG